MKNIILLMNKSILITIIQLLTIKNKNSQILKNKKMSITEIQYNKHICIKFKINNFNSENQVF